MSDLIDLDPASTDPPYEQLRARISELARTGGLAPHTRLPAVRRLATDLNIAPGTVARAYRELEVAGLVLTRGRLGTVVSSDAVSPDGTSGDAVAGVSVDAAVRLAAGDYARGAGAAGIPDGDVVALVSEALRRLPDPR